MRFLTRTLCVKLKKFLLLLLFLATSIFTITYVHNRPIILNSRIRREDHERPEKPSKVPGAFLKGLKPGNGTFCNFGYGLPERFSYGEEDLEFGPELGEEGGYRVLYNVVSLNSNGSEPDLTYATHLTPEFVGYLSELPRYWEGPVSAAAFAPGQDVDAVLSELVLLCRCLPHMARVSVHLVFPVGHEPHVQLDGRQEPSSSCFLSPPPSIQTARHELKLSYPVNVCRNVARNASTTNHVLVSDVELFPSANLATGFLQLLSKLKSNTKLNLNAHPHVFVLPTFEVASRKELPRTKQDLLTLVRQENAVYFHRHLCSHCQKFPGIERWLEQDPGKGVKVFSSASRVFPYHRWEPIYIATKREPYYPEMLSWEGKQDKMTQMLELCLLGYRFIILDGAFLAHWPGIKRKTVENRRNKWRTSYQRNNTRQYQKILSELRTKYVVNKKCKVQ